MLWTRKQRTLAERACEDCHACCIALGFEARDGVSPFRKEENTPCPHLVQIGCEIYADRPPVCRRFRCVWLDSPGLPDDLRPDRCGVMFWANANQVGEGMAVYAYELRPGAAEGPLPSWLIGQVSRDVTVVIVRPERPSEVVTRDPSTLHYRGPG